MDRVYHDETKLKEKSLIDLKTRSFLEISTKWKQNQKYLILTIMVLAKHENKDQFLR